MLRGESCTGLCAAGRRHRCFGWALCAERTVAVAQRCASMFVGRGAGRWA